MEIKIIITKQNKDEILKLIDQLVESESKAILAKTSDELNIRQFQNSDKLTLKKQIPPKASMIFADPIFEDCPFGTWGMFNSFVPGKVALRILIGLLKENNELPVRFSDLIDKCLEHFLRLNLGKYRGFPKKTSESARGRFANHLVTPFQSMGLIRFFGEGKERTLKITKSGFDFAKLENGLLDKVGKKKYLTREESDWLINYLIKIDNEGFKEFSILKNLTDFVSKKTRNFKELKNWLKEDKEFVNWLRKGSRYENNPKAFLTQLDNVSRTMLTGKIALLRDMEILNDKRGEYTVLRKL